jgi:hypothetical protein
MARLAPPIPQDKIQESFVWRDWFQRLSDRVYGTMASQDAGSVTITGGNVSGISLVGNDISGAFITGSLVDSTPIGLTIASTGNFTTIFLDNALAAIYGGTGQSSVTTGDVLYGSGVNTWSKLAIGSSGQVLRVTAGIPAWGTDFVGTVTSVSVVSANGFAGTVANATTTPAITLTTSITGLLKGNGTAISAAVANTDYVPLSTVLTKTADYSIAGTDTWIINNKSGSALTLTFPAASSWTGRYITVKNMQAQLVNSATSNIVPLDSTTAGTAILLDVIGNWATLVSDGTNWIIMQAASNNNLLLE